MSGYRPGYSGSPEEWKFTAYVTCFIIITIAISESRGPVLLDAVFQVAVLDQLLPSTDT
jgi:hypothetical protein